MPQLQDVVKPAIQDAIATFQSLGISGESIDALVQADESITVDNAAQVLQSLARVLTDQLESLRASQGNSSAQLTTQLASLRATLAQLESSQATLQNSIGPLQQRINGEQQQNVALQQDLNSAVADVQRLDSAIAQVQQQIDGLQQQQ